MSILNKDEQAHILNSACHDPLSLCPGTVTGENPVLMRIPPIVRL
jgi:hypothetical protein